MPDPIPPKHSLVLYKNYPALVTQPGDKIDIALQDGKSVSVRPKDITPLHPGPIRSFSELQPQQGEINVAWELLAGQTTTLSELADLIYETYSPATAWAAWQLIDDGLYFHGTPEAVQARLPDEVAQIKTDRETKNAEKQAWAAFLARIETGQVAPEDDRYLTEVEMLALGQQDHSRVLKELGQAQSRENAHALLLNLGYWDDTDNPYPHRFQLATASPEMPLPPLPDEPRVDLTHLPAFAIDDAGSRDPDDAISLDGNRLWVHVADVAALIPPGSPADLEARARGASLYLPEGTVTMLPPQATERLALGLSEISPALSFGLDIDPNGRPTLAEIVPSQVRVQRLSYQEAENQLAKEPLRSIHYLAQAFAAQRRANGAIELDLPEVKIRVKAGEIAITPLLPLKSRDLVREAMLMTGEAVADFALQNEIPLLFSTQDPPNSTDKPFPNTLSGMFARRRTMQRSQLSSQPGPHIGLGLEFYAQATSPLRRYADLVTHQQLRAFRKNRQVLSEAEVLARVGAADAVSGSVRQAERLANKHWTLVYLKRRPNWRGEGVLVETYNRRGRVLIPALDLEFTLYLKAEFPLDHRLTLQLRDVNLPELDASFQIAT